MNWKALVIALVLGSTGLALLFQYKQRFEARVGGGPQVGVLIATRDIPMGTRLTAEMLGIRPLPQSYLEERHIRAGETQRIVGLRVRSRVRANESILWSDLATSAGDARSLAELVTPGMRAVAIPATLSSAFEGLLQPGDRVDALLTVKKEGSGERITIPLLQNLLVLALGEDVGGERLDKSQAGAGRYQRATVTLGAAIEQAQMLAFAAAHGELTLTLRNPEDLTVVKDLPETTLAHVLKPDQRAAFQRAQSRVEGPKLIEHAE